MSELSNAGSRPKDSETNVDSEDGYITDVNVFEVRSVRRGGIQDSSLDQERSRENLKRAEVGQAWTTKVNFCGDEVGQTAVQANFNKPEEMYETFGKTEEVKELGAESSMEGDVMVTDLVEQTELKYESGTEAVAVGKVAPLHVRLEDDLKEISKMLGLEPTLAAAQELVDSFSWLLAPPSPLAHIVLTLQVQDYNQA